MARNKKERSDLYIDMTAMSDMAWLLLTFFVLTTQFRKPEIVPVNTPSSVAETKLQDGNIVQITVNDEGRYYFGIIDDHHKEPDRKSTRLNSSHVANSYAGFCLTKQPSTVELVYLAI